MRPCRPPPCERRPELSSRRASYGRLGAAARSAKQEDPDQTAERPNDEPVAPEPPSCSRVAYVHAGLGREAVVAYPEIHDRLTGVWSRVREELVGSPRPLGLACPPTHAPELPRQPEDDPLARSVLEDDPGQLPAD